MLLGKHTWQLALGVFSSESFLFLVILKWALIFLKFSHHQSQFPPHFRKSSHQTILNYVLKYSLSQIPYRLTSLNRWSILQVECSLKEFNFFHQRYLRLQHHHHFHHRNRCLQSFNNLNDSTSSHRHQLLIKFVVSLRVLGLLQGICD